MVLLSAVLLIVSCGEVQDTPAVTTATITADTTDTALTQDTSAQTSAKSTTATTTVQTAVITTANTTAGTLQLFEDKKPVFQVVSSLDLFKDTFLSAFFSFSVPALKVLEIFLIASIFRYLLCLLF